MDDSSNPIVCDASVETLTWQEKVFEQNNEDMVYGGHKVGQDKDHFFWQSFYATIANGGATFTQVANLPKLFPGTTQNVTVTFDIFTSVENSDQSDYNHHFELYLGTSSSKIDERVVEGAGYKQLVFSLPARYFLDGNNTISLKVLPTYLPPSCGGTACADRVFINKFNVKYPASKLATNHKIEFSNRYTNTLITVGGFSESPINVWDISDSGAATKVLNVDTSIANQVTYLTNSGLSETFGKKYFAFTVSAVLSPVAYELTQGFEESLRDTNMRADYLIIGEGSLLPELYQLVDRRNSEGLETKLVSLDQIYAEFSNNQVSSYAIREFVSFAKTYWQKKPTYILIVGDGTYDPTLKMGYDEILKSTPIPVVSGKEADFASDNWFVTPDEFGVVPNLILGRIPTSSKSKIRKYIEKVLAYEDGTRAPTTTNSKKAVFISGVPKGAAQEKYENYEADSESVMEKFSAISSGHSTTHIKQSLAVSDAAFVSSINSQFNNAPIIINYFGHGAPDGWGATIKYFNTDLDSLTNVRLPILASFSCENGKFFSTDESDISFGESSVLNADGGAIAFFGATYQTSPSAQKIFADAFYNELARALNTSNENYRIGSLMYAGKVALGDAAHTRDVLNSYVLLGDPTLKIPKSVFNPTAFALVDSGAVSGTKAPVGGGCSAFAGDDRYKRNWIDGIFEILFLMLIYCSTRKFFNKSNS